MTGCINHETWKTPLPVRERGEVRQCSHTEWEYEGDFASIGGLTTVINSRYSKTQLGIPGIYVTLIGIVVEFPWYRGLPE